MTEYCENTEADCCEYGDPDEICGACGKPVRPAPHLPKSKPSLLAREVAQRKATAATDTAPHVIVEARAGSGKTTTLVEGLKILKGLGSKLTPSPQQQAVWEAIAQSRSARSVCFVAFNKSIANELKTRVPAGCDAMTMHSLGLRAVTQQFGRLEISSYVVQDLIAELLGQDIRALRKKDLVLLTATEDLVRLCKMNLATGTPEELEELARHYEVELNHSKQRVFELVPKVLERCKTPKSRINFDDMIWLPVVLNLPLPQYDLLLVDEAQDLNRCQQALAKRAGRRLILCGDPKQAIYGFAGADAESMPRLTQELAATERGCITLPLTVTRRCGKAIVQEANRYVKDFDAHESNPVGIIGEALYPVQKRGDTTREISWEESYCARVQEGDFLLCRVNAPLVSQCFRFLQRGRKATIQGRDVGQGLVSLIKKLMKDHADRDYGKIPLFLERLEEWHYQETTKEEAKRNPSEAKLIALADRVACLHCFADDASTGAAMITRIEALFTDDKDKPGIRLSSVHKAKGLEAKRVFLLQPQGASMPHPLAKSAWQVQQELNLLYVAITRAIEELVYVY